MPNILADPKHIQRVRFLYKIVMKLHRGLPNELKTLGDLYAREEFKRHKTCNEHEATVFMNEWTNYAITLSQQLGLKGPKFSAPLGVDLKVEDLDQLREDQVQQLYDLMVAAKGEDAAVGDDKKGSGT